MAQRTILDYAFVYATRGWRVLPLNGKVPILPAWTKTASTNTDQLREWWEKYPSANVGLATGSESGFFVVDIDGERGAASLADLETTFGKLPETYEVETARGRHLYFKQPVNFKTKTQASGELGLKIDIRGDGGQVAAPPSIHPETKRAYKIKNDISLADAPQWLLDFVNAERVKKQSKNGDSNLIPDKITHSRNATLTKIAGQVRHIGAGAEELESFLLKVNIQHCVPRLEEREVITIAHSVAKYPPGRCLSSGTINDSEFSAHNASDIDAKPVTWRWPGFLPRGSLVTWSGDPGQGKSNVAFTIAAAITRGDLLPGDDGQEKYEPASVMIISAEDDQHRTIRPRLELAGADLRRVKLINSLMSSGKPISFPEHLVQLTEMIRETKSELVIIDPLDAFLGEDIDSHKNADVRRTLMPFTAISENTNCIILLISHLNKSSQSSAMYRVSGSIAFIAAARAAFVFGQSAENEEEHLFACLKSNLAKKPKPLRYAIDDTVVSGLGNMPKIRWLGESDTETATTILAAPVNGTGETQNERNEAKTFLRQALESGPRSAKELYYEARDLCSKRTLDTAKKELHVRSMRVMNKWMWALAAYKWQREPGDEDECN